MVSVCIEGGWWVCMVRVCIEGGWWVCMVSMGCMCVY